MTRYLMATVMALLFGMKAWAGGRPAVYVVVDKVILEPSADAPERVRIQGYFVRVEDSDRFKYSKPVEGYIYLGIETGKEKECKAEWAKWQKTAGTGKAVNVGASGVAGTFLTVKIHKLDEKIDRPDGAYTTNHLGVWGGLYAEDAPWADDQPVIDLLAFAKARKETKPERK
jgi:hypothetical protein